MKCPISVVLLTRNEEINIVECLKSCDFAQEIVVVDDGSTDKTVELAQELGAHVFKRDINDDWGQQETYGISQATCPWILLLDADERVTDTLRVSIERAIEKDEKYCYAIQRENHFKNIRVNHGAMRPDWVSRLMPRKGARVEGRVHQKVISPFQPRKIRGRLIHFTYKNWDQYFDKQNKYAKLSALKYMQEGRNCSFFYDVLLRPIWAFFKVYVFNGGFLDGKAGFMFAAGHYTYTLSKYIRFYQLKYFQGEM